MSIMIGSRFSGIAVRKSEIAASGPLVPAVESPTRVRDRQTGQPSFVLSGQYPITAYYVNLRLTFQIVCHIWRKLPRWGLTKWHPAPL